MLRLQWHAWKRAVGSAALACMWTPRSDSLAAADQPRCSSCSVEAELVPGGPEPGLTCSTRLLPTGTPRLPVEPAQGLQCKRTFDKCRFGGDLEKKGTHGKQHTYV